MKIFVFGSNLAGRHGKGAALYAKRHHGAIYGQGVGLQGTSYAIPTKDADLEVLPIPEIQKYIEEFKQYARENQEMTFEVTRIGCGLAGYSDQEIAPFFKDCPSNCNMPEEWIPIIGKS